MPVTFYPHDDDLTSGTIPEKLDVMMESAERFKAAVLDAGTTLIVKENGKQKLTPREIQIAFNWQEIAKLLREIRELPESNVTFKNTKADRLKRLAEIYEVLRGAKMPKLEAVRLALMNEAGQLTG